MRCVEEGGCVPVLPTSQYHTYHGSASASNTAKHSGGSTAHFSSIFVFGLWDAGLRR